MISVDTVALTSLVNACFDNSMDGRFAPNVQSQFLAWGHRLRGDLMSLLSAKFSDGTAAVLAANTQIQNVNTQVSQAATNLGKAAATMTSLSNLASVLDQLLQIAAKFI